MKVSCFLILILLLASCSTSKFYIGLDGTSIGDDDFYIYSPSVEKDNVTSTFTKSQSRFGTITANKENTKLKFRYLEPKKEIAKEKIIIMMPGNQAVWLSLMPTASLLLNEGYHLVIIDYYGEKNGFRSEKKKDWAEKEIDEIILLTEVLQSIDNFRTYDIGYFGSSLGSLAGLRATAETSIIKCFVGEGTPVNPRKSAENILDKSFWLDLWIDLDDYEELIKKLDPIKNLKTIGGKTSVYLFWGDDDEYVFEDKLQKIKNVLDSNSDKNAYKVFKDAKHSNRLGLEISPEKFHEINNSIIKYFNENL
ncbi:prolyl oligopeptidase family serine peptidase [Candidatus Kapabacteria bacterium]|nr:prolyl oligopeptidase family serine peptidase [Candidatus Kapabacteria bacterium]